MAIRADDLPKVILDIFSEYEDNIAEAVADTSLDVANRSAEKLKQANTYQVRSGDYNAGWEVDKGKKYKQSVSRFVHNATDYQLTHLLEYGHATRNGGRTRAFVHIKPVEDWAKAEYESELTKAIKGAS